MSLDKYQNRRKFNKTNEPKGELFSKSKNRFVVQEHHARNLHWDFRLEMESEIGSGEVVLKSWAVPKGLPENIEDKRLAMATEDHPVDYINFKGEIPQGEYGAGKVKIWDKGKFKIINRTDSVYEYELFGKKAKGRFSLVKINYAPNSWLMIKLK